MILINNFFFQLRNSDLWGLSAAEDVYCHIYSEFLDLLNNITLLAEYNTE